MHQPSFFSLLCLMPPSFMYAKVRSDSLYHPFLSTQAVLPPFVPCFALCSPYASVTDYFLGSKSNTHYRRVCFCFSCFLFLIVDTICCFVVFASVTLFFYNAFLPHSTIRLTVLAYPSSQEQVHERNRHTRARGENLTKLSSLPSGMNNLCSLFL